MLSFVAGCVELFWGNFIDEGDNIALGLLIARGYVLYRDLFSHHFPFPYYWVAGVTGLFGPSILAVRLSVLLFQTAAFAVTMWLTGFPVSIGLAAVIWRAVAPLYYGNMIIYHNFLAATLPPVCIVTLAVAGRYIRAGQREILALGIGSAVAVLCDPLAVYPVCLSLIVLLSAGGGRSALQVGAVISVVVSLCAGYLLITGAFTPFVHDTILFNAQVYSKYVRVDLVPIHSALRTGLKALDLFAPRWMNPDPLRPINYLHPDRWLFTGFLYRVSIILAGIVLLRRRTLLAAAFIYSFAAILIAAVGDERFRAVPFIVLALFSAAWFVAGEWQHAGLSAESLWQVLPRSTGGHVLVLVARAIVGLMLGWLLVRGAAVIIQDRRWLSYAANFGKYDQQVEILKALSCRRSDVSLAYYPADPLVHFFSGMRPASRYMIMLPWIAEIALPEVTHDLESKEAIVYIELRGEIWGRKNREYLAGLTRFLDAKYTKLSDRLYVSPRLAKECPVSQWK